MAKEVEDVESRIYEVGVHFVSMLPVEQVEEKFATLKKFILKTEGEIISEEAPSLIDLAYTMIKHVAGKNQKYDTAHFSWIKFEIEAPKIATIKETLEADKEVLRFLIVKTVRENTLHADTLSPEIKKEKKVEKVAKEVPKEDIKEEKIEMDKAIDELVN